MSLNAHIPKGKRILTRDEEYGIAVYYAAGIPIKDISARFGGISRSAINRVVTRLGVETDRGKRSSRALSRGTVGGMESNGRAEHG